MTHLTRDELASWRRTAAEADRDRIVGHLAACDACAGMYADIIRDAVDERPAHFNAADFRDAGYRVLAPTRRPLLLRPRVLFPLGVAAALVAAVWVPTLRRTVDVPATPAQVMRGGAPVTIAPSGEVSGAVEFRWTAPAGADRYAIEVKDQAGRRVFYRETRDDRLAVDAAAVAALPQGTRLLWTVSTLDGAGEPIAQSAPRAFTRPPQ